MIVTKPSSIARLVCITSYTGLMGDKDKSYKLLFSHAQMVESSTENQLKLLSLCLDFGIHNIISVVTLDKKAFHLSQCHICAIL